MLGRQTSQADMQPLMQKPKAALFAPGHRLRMNVLPMFLNIFIPWGIFIYCFGLCSFHLMYSQPILACLCVSMVFVVWLVFVLLAYCARRYDPDPTWFTFFSILAGICALWGILAGLKNLDTYEKPYYTITEMKDTKGIDPITTKGENVMDAGIMTFVQGTAFDTNLTWHFKKGKIYCAAPLISTSGTVPLSQTYDYWAVGEDCCSIAASDFRCGSWGLVSAHSGLRVIDEEQEKYYRLAVQQAESLYDIMAPRPIFLKWSDDPLGEVASWKAQSFKNFMVTSATNLIFCIFVVTMASARFAFLGRTQSAYYSEVLNEVPREFRNIDMSAKMYTA